jgi:hypothetical protein
MSPRRILRAFVLIEVLVAMVLLAISMTAILRGFIIALSTIRENRLQETAMLLAQSLLDDYEIEPPTEGRQDGAFREDLRFAEGFENFYWERRVEEVDVDYDEIPKSPLQKFEPLYEMELRIIYDDGRFKKYTPLVLNTMLLDVQLFSSRSIQENQLY